MKYAYAISKRKREIRIFNFTAKTSQVFSQNAKGYDEVEKPHRWVDLPGDGQLWKPSYVPIEKLTAGLGNAVIISSDLRFPEICEMMSDVDYEHGHSSFDEDSKMLMAYSKLTETETISLEDLIKAMQQ